MIVDNESIHNQQDEWRYSYLLLLKILLQEEVQALHFLLIYHFQHQLRFHQSVFHLLLFFFIIIIQYEIIRRRQRMWFYILPKPFHPIVYTNFSLICNKLFHLYINYYKRVNKVFLYISNLFICKPFSIYCKLWITIWWVLVMIMNCNNQFWTILVIWNWNFEWTDIDPDLLITNKKRDFWKFSPYIASNAHNSSCCCW